MTAQPKDRTAERLELFGHRALDFAERVEAGEIELRDAVDIVYDSAVASGIVDAVGVDEVQAIMAKAFAPVKRRRS